MRCLVSCAGGERHSTTLTANTFAPSQHHPCCHRPEDIAAFVARHPGLRYDSALEQYARVARLSPHYRLGTLENILALATMLQARSLQGPLAVRIYTCCRQDYSYYQPHSQPPLLPLPSRMPLPRDHAADCVTLFQSGGALCVLRLPG